MMSSSAGEVAMVRVRAWIVTMLSVASLAMLVATTVAPDWIERVFGAEPDRRDGSAEVIATLALLAVTVISGVGAVVSWRRLLSR
jgi:small-conductance mechanosensitive channel